MMSSCSDDDFQSKAAGQSHNKQNVPIFLIPKKDADVKVPYYNVEAVKHKVHELAWCEMARDSSETEASAPPEEEVLETKEKKGDDEKKAESGNGYILSNLAFIYDFAGDKPRKIETLRKGADLRDPTCLYNLADAVKKYGYEETIKHLTIAGMELNHVPSLQRLAVYFLDSNTDGKDRGIKQDGSVVMERSS